MAQALRLASEFAAGVVVGGGIGWVVDRVFGVSPWGLITFVLLGFAAGVLNVMRSAGVSSTPPENSGRASEEVEHGNGSDPSV
jgi:F0F1-type ATP synthase assembly protein I